MSRKLRIVHCFRSPVGGLFRHVRDLAGAQLAAGHDVGIVCDSNTGGAYEDKLFEEIAPRYAERNGGYTRIVKIGPRKSDSTEMVFLELV